MRPRCVELARVLKKTGSFYYHCDWHASHYVKVMLDQIFGENNFQNEIIWKRHDAHSNDVEAATARFTTRSSSTPAATNTRGTSQYQPYDRRYIETFYTIHETDDVAGVTTYGDLTEPAKRHRRQGNPTLRSAWASQRVLAILTMEDMEKLRRQGLITFRPRTAVPRAETVPRRMQGRARCRTSGTTFDPINTTAQERLGYPTQKPLALLERIIKASSNPNDIVLDAFCGCGTALVAAENLGRQWIGIDISPTACRVMAKRLRDVCHIREDEKLWRIGRGFVVRDLPWTEEQLRKLPPFEFENWAVIALGGIPNKAQVGDMGIDGRIYPVSAMPKKAGEAAGELGFMDDWYPIQVKQKDKVGRPDIDAFEAAMTREDRTKGFFVAFDYSQTP